MMSNEVYIDGCNVAECEFLLSNYECMSNYKMIDCDGKITQFYKCKDCPNCYFKQLQRAKADIEELKESNLSNNDKLKEEKSTDYIEFKQYYKAENDKLQAENEKLKEDKKQLLKDCNSCNFHKYKQALKEVREWLLKWQFNANIIKHTKEPLNKISEVLND